MRGEQVRSSSRLHGTDRELGRVGPGRPEVRLDPGHDVGMLDGDVVRLADVVLDVVELQRLPGAEPDGLPVAGPHRLLEPALVELPVEELMGDLIALAEDGGDLGDAVDPGGD